MNVLRILFVLAVVIATFWLGAFAGDEFGGRSMPITGGIRIPADDARAASDHAPLGTAHPRFKVELINIHAIDETGAWDFTGSDNLFVVYDTAEHRTHFSIYEVDSGDVVQISTGTSCIWPIATTDDPTVWTCRLT